MSNQYFLFASNVLTAAFVCDNKLAEMVDYEYTNNVLDQVYSILQGIKVDEAFVIFDVLISREVCRDSFVIGEVNGRTHKRNVLASITDFEKLQHLLKSAGVEKISFVSITDVIPGLFNTDVCVVYENKYGTNVFLFSDGRTICESATDSMCASVAKNLMLGTGVARVETVANNDKRNELQTQYEPIGADDADDVEYLLSIFEVAREVAPVFGFTANDFSHFKQFRGTEDEASGRKTDVEFISSDSKTSTVVEQPARGGTAKRQMSGAASSVGGGRIGSAPDRSKQSLVRKVKRGQIDDTVEVLAERKKRSKLPALAGMVGALLLLLTIAGFVCNFYFGNALAEVSETNEVLTTNVRAYQDETISMLEYAANEFSSDTLGKALNSSVVKKAKEKTVYEVYCNDLYVRVVLGFSTKKALNKACKNIEEEYTVVYKSVNNDVQVNDLDTTIEETGAIISADVLGNLKPSKYKCVLVLTERTGR